MKSNLTLMILFLFALATIAGCSVDVETASSDQTAATNSAGSEASPAAEKKLDLTGDWRIDAQETIKANSALMKNPNLDKTAFRIAIRSMILDFLLNEDGTFNCYEKGQGMEADYTGRWELKGNKLGLYQETMNGEPEKDELVGTVEGDRMDMVHKQAGVEINMVLKKWKPKGKPEDE